MSERECQICGRKEGTLLERDMMTYAEPPLGPVEKCDTCGRWACPDCMHEADCCFVEEDEHSNDPKWAPPGWRKEPSLGKRGETIFVRIRKSA